MINHSEVHAFRKDPGEAILSYEYLIEIIIKKYVKSGSIASSEYIDFKQNVFEILIKKATIISSQFQGLAKFSSYLAVVIQNICNEIIRSQKNFQYVSIDYVYQQRSDEPNPESVLIIEQEKLKLNSILNLFFKNKAKVILCLKAKFLVPFQYDDFKLYNPNITLEEFNFCQSALSEGHIKSNKSVYMRLVHIFNTYEGKNINYDSVRKYCNTKIEEIIKLLNGNPPASKYTEETFQILFEKMIDAKEYKNINSINLLAK